MTVDRIDSDFIYTIFEGVGSNTRSGDSGGPLFVQEAGTWVIAGVTSGGDTADCLSGSNDFANLRHAEIMGHVLGLVPAAEQR